MTDMLNGKAWMNILRILDNQIRKGKLMKKIFNFIYVLLLIVGVMAGIYGIGYESILLKWVGAILVFGMLTITFLVEYAIKENK